MRVERHLAGTLSFTIQGYGVSPSARNDDACVSNDNLHVETVPGFFLLVEDNIGRRAIHSLCLLLLGSCFKYFMIIGPCLFSQALKELSKEKEVEKKESISKALEDAKVGCFPA